MKTLRTGLSLAATTAVMLVLPAGATAEYLVPPQNSAATQYTEAIPSAGGPRSSEHRRQGKEGRSPTEVLGARNVRRLRDEGEQGHEVALVATETAPETLVRPAPPAASRGKPAASDDAAGGGRASLHARSQSSDSSGSSGSGEVAGQALGSSSSSKGMGLLMPLLILAALAWSIAYWARRRGRTAA